MAFRLNLTMKNSIVNDAIEVIAGTTGTAGTAVMKIYTGSQPATADDATSGDLLVTLSSISWDLCTGGTSALTSTVEGTNSATGTAGWARLETIGASGTFRLDGDVGTGGTCVFVINDAIFTTAGGAVSLLTAPIYVS